MDDKLLMQALRDMINLRDGVLTATDWGHGVWTVDHSSDDGRHVGTFQISDIRETETELTFELDEEPELDRYPRELLDQTLRLWSEKLNASPGASIVVLMSFADDTEVFKFRGEGSLEDQVVAIHQSVFYALSLAMQRQGYMLDLQRTGKRDGNVIAVKVTDFPSGN